MQLQHFYEIFAQCSATLIGIIGAFIIAKILDEGNNFVETEIEFHDLIKSGMVLETEASNFDIEKFKRIKGNSSLWDEYVKMKLANEKIEAKYLSHCAAQNSLLKSTEDAKGMMEKLVWIILWLMIGVVVLIGLPLGFSAYTIQNPHCITCCVEMISLSSAFVFIAMLLIFMEALFIYFLIQVIDVRDSYNTLHEKFKERYADSKKWKLLLNAPFNPDNQTKLEDL